MGKVDVKIRGIERKDWNWFVGHCKQRGKTVGQVIQEFIKKLKK